MEEIIHSSFKDIFAGVLQNQTSLTKARLFEVLALSCGKTRSCGRTGILTYGLKTVRDCRLYDLEKNPWAISRSHGIGFDFYLILYDIEGIAPGIYKFLVKKEALSPVRLGFFSKNMAEILFGEQAPHTASLTLVFVADFDRYSWRYRHEEALLALYMDAGWICQELILAALAYDLKTFTTPGVKDKDLMTLLEIPTLLCPPVYTLTIGY